MLEVLGDGKQRKSYLDVIDGVDGIFYAVEHAKELRIVFNLGHDAFMNVLDLADILSRTRSEESSIRHDRRRARVAWRLAIRASRHYQAQGTWMAAAGLD